MKNYILKLADDSLVMGQRLAEWCGKGPYLEEDIALTNIALDYLGQSNQLFEYAADLSEKGTTADQLAFLRYEPEYLNCQLVELPNGDYAQTLLKVYFFSLQQLILFEKLSQSGDERLQAIAQKSYKEVKYHFAHARMWLEIFAKGTAESQLRLNQAIEVLWEYTGGLFDATQGEEDLKSLELIPSSQLLYKEWQERVNKDFLDFGLQVPSNNFMQKGSRTGYHTEYFGYLLCELQYMQRAYPGCQW